MTEEPPASNRPPSGWIVRNGEERVEAADLPALLALAGSGTLRSESYVYDATSAQWRYANEIPELQAALQGHRDDSAAWVVNAGGSSTAVRDVATLQAWVHDFRIEKTTKIRNPHLQRWVTAGEILELREAFATRPDIVFDAPKPPGGFPAWLAAALAALAVLSAVAFWNATHRPAPATAQGVNSTPAANTTAAQAVKAPKMTVLTFGKDSAGNDVTTTTTVTDSIAPTATAPSTTAGPTSTATPVVAQPQPAARPAPIDDAEVDPDEESDYVVRGNDAIRVAASGDTPVVIDRSGRDSHYHLSGCSKASGDLATVSLDLARQGRSPCPVCRPPG